MTQDIYLWGSLDPGGGERGSGLSGKTEEGTQKLTNQKKSYFNVIFQTSKLMPQVHDEWNRILNDDRTQSCTYYLSQYTACLTLVLALSDPANFNFLNIA